MTDDIVTKLYEEGIREVPLWERVKTLEDNYDPKAISELQEIRATLLVNFGPKNRGIIEDKGRTLKLLIEVLEHYIRDDVD